MPWSGSGVYTLVHDWVNDKNSAINPQASRFKAQDDDIATAFNNCLTRDAQGKPSSDFSFNSFKGTGLGNATTRTDAVNAGQYQDAALTLAGSVAGTDTITASLSPAITAYANGMVVRFIPANTNTGAATLNLNSVAARSIVKSTGVALVAGDLVAGIPAAVVYDLANTRWLLVNNAKVPDAALSSNVPLLNAVLNTFTGAQLVSSTLPQFLWNSTGASADNRKWNALVNSSTWELRAYDDALNLSSTAVSITRTAGSPPTITGIALTATAITLNAVNITDYSRLSQSNTYTNAAQGINAVNGAWSITDGSVVSAFTANWGGTVSNNSWSIRTNNSNRVTVDTSGVITTNNTSAGEFGYKGAPLVGVSGGYTLVLTDCGKTVKSTSGNITIPDDAAVVFPDGTIIKLHNRTGGNITITKTTSSGLIWDGIGTTGARTLANNSTAAIYKSQADEWLISGTGLT